MFKKNYQLLFYLFLMLGSLLSISSNSWFTAWIGLEINLMGLIPIILSDLNYKNTEAAIKYFLTQAMASLILISSSMIMIHHSLFMELNQLSYLVIIALAIKLGMAPFHMWFPQVMMLMSWFKGFIILTWQKMAPFILFFNSKMTFLVMMLVIISSMVGSMGGLNQVYLKMILTYSSISHSGWLLVILLLSFQGWMLYFSIYIILITSILSLTYLQMINSTLEITQSNMHKLTKILFSFSIMSLGGLPPFLGFMAKMMTITLMLPNMPLILIILLIISSLLTLFYYMKMFYPLMTYKFLYFKNSFFKMENFHLKTFLSLSMFMNIFFPMLVLLA